MKKILKRFNQFKIIITYYIVVFFVKFFQINENIWLISERGNEARDNGFAFYKYLKNYHKDIKVKFIISKNSKDRDRIAPKDIVNYRSLKHYIYYASSKYLISTHLQGTSPEFHSFSKLAANNKLYNKGKSIFLQHGITKDFIPSMKKECNKNLNLFICGAKDEFIFLKSTLGYSDSEIKYTGFARFDYLKGNLKNQILLMPTWRSYLYNSNENDFKESDYFKKYNSLINNNNLIKLLKKYKMDLIFYPHYEVQKYLHLFNSKSSRIKIASKNNYDVQKLLIESKILITDYSSVFFDFAYMRKPILYYQFDYQKYRETQYSEGYFSYDSNGFGPILKSENNLIIELQKAFEDLTVDDFYLKRIDKFFELNDENNSKRIFEEILKLE